MNRFLLIVTAGLAMAMCGMAAVHCQDGNSFDDRWFDRTRSDLPKLEDSPFDRDWYDFRHFDDQWFDGNRDNRRFNDWWFERDRDDYRRFNEWWRDRNDLRHFDTRVIA